MKKLLHFTLFFTLCSNLILAQSIRTATMQELAYEYAHKSLGELHEFYSLPNDAYMPAQLEPNIAWVDQAFQKRGFTIKKLPTEGIDLVLAEMQVDASLPTVLFYVQVDGQPVDPTKWNQKGPFVPTLKKETEKNEWEEISWNSLDNKEKLDPDWRIFARSASDAKGPYYFLPGGYGCT